jgi:hypothetical protein
MLYEYENEERGRPGTSKDELEEVFPTRSPQAACGPRTFLPPALSYPMGIEDAFHGDKAAEA